MSEILSDSQRQRLTFGIIAVFIGAIISIIGINSVSRYQSGAMTPVVVGGVLLVAAGVYLLISFGQRRKRG